MSPPLPPDDLRLVADSVGPLWQRLAGARVLFTGASGFFGSWMLETFLHAGTQLGLPFRALALTRDRSRFSQSLPHLATDPRVEILESDAATMPVPDGPVDFVIHSMVPPAGTRLGEMARFFPAATQHLLEVAQSKSAKGFLLCSTGAVYLPKDPPAPFSEGDPLHAADGPLSYGQIRRRIEDQCLAAWMRGSLPVKIARGFTFLGPRLPLDGAFAAGNFLRDAMAGGPIVVRGDGSPVRSYLYAADLAAWLWTILLDGRPGLAYNVGSHLAITISTLARRIGSRFRVDVCLGSEGFPGAAPSCYLPATSRAEAEFGPMLHTSLRDGIDRMASWYAKS